MTTIPTQTTIPSTAYMKISSAVTAGQWVHIAGVFDGSAVKLYINGQQVAETAASGTFSQPDSSSQYLGIGADSGKDAQTIETAFQGKIADTKLYSAALSAEQIAARYSAYQVK